jgi:hypothetical protein
MGRADWMAGRWGMMVHWIAPGPPPELAPYRTDLNDAVNHFNVPRFLEDFAATGANWLIFTVGQNTGDYASPSRLLDEWAGPGHCSDRDLVQEIMDGVTNLPLSLSRSESQTAQDYFVTERLRRISINRMVTHPGVKVQTLRMLHQANIQSAFDLQQRGMPTPHPTIANRLGGFPSQTFPTNQVEAVQNWLQSLVDELQKQFVTHRPPAFIAYLPCEVAANTTVHEAFHWTKQENTDQRAFQERYTEFVREWSLRWGTKCSGWWFDGCYTWPIFHNKHMQWPLWFDAARAGNPKSALAFNDGSFCIGKTTPVTDAQDYLSGEVEILSKGKIRLDRGRFPKYHTPQSGKVDGTQCQWHALVPIDCVWAHGSPPGGVFSERFVSVPADPIFPMEKTVYWDEELLSFMASCLSVGGAVTLNVGIYQEGHLGTETVAKLKRLRPALEDIMSRYAEKQTSS